MLWNGVRASVLACAVMVATGCTPEASADASGPGGPPAERERPAPGVRVAAVEKGPIEASIPFTGELVARERVTLAPEVSGRLSSLSVDVGDAVVEGAVLAEVDATLATRDLQLERARLEVVAARLAQAEAAVAIAERELERMRALVASNVRTETEQLELVDALARAEAARDVAAAERVQQQRAVERAQSERARYSVVAPFDGVVTAREVSVGQTVSAQAPILTLVSPASLRLVVEVPESALAAIAPDQRARVALDALGSGSMDALVDRIVPAVNVTSRTVEVELTVDAPEGRLREGMFGRGAFVLERVSDALLVPIQSVHTNRETGASMVWVVDDENVATPTPVVERMRDERHASVEGVPEGATVITSPVERLTPGGAVIVVNR